MWEKETVLAQQTSVERAEWQESSYPSRALQSLSRQQWVEDKEDES